ncbi:hypothetical protein D3C75_383420 [compost metagenome]
MERVFRSLKTEWIPTMGYRTAQEAQRDISQFLMHRYNWIRPHQFNGGLAPARAEEKLNVVSGISWPLQKHRHAILLPLTEN